MDYHMENFHLPKTRNNNTYMGLIMYSFGLDNNLQCSDDHLYLRYIFKSVPYTYTNTHIYIPIYTLYIIYTYIYIPV